MARRTQATEADRADFLAAHPGLGEALETDHPIARDIAGRFHRYGSVSEKQIALVLKLAREARDPKPAERMVAAPTGKVTFRGVVVSCKSAESAFGGLKCTIKVTTDDGGTWLAWGTAPAGALDNAALGIRGCEVEVTATLKAGREPHFAIMQRPRARILRDVHEKCARCYQVHETEQFTDAPDGRVCARCVHEETNPPPPVPDPFAIFDEPIRADVA